MLNETEIRVLACLVEKEITTPDYYPLTLNSLVHACNQKSNRDPVVSFTEEQVEKILRNLKEKKLSDTVYLEAGNRVLKYTNSFADVFKLDRKETAVLCELMLRGPQTPGELHSRADRMCPFESLDEVVNVLKKLSGRTPALVAFLPRQPGRKEIRYAHLLSGELPATVRPEAVPSGETAGIEAIEQVHQELRSRIEILEQEVRTLKERLSGGQDPAAPGS